MSIWLKGARAPLVLNANIRALKPNTKPGFKLSTGAVTVNKRYDGQRSDINIVCNQENVEYEVERIICGNSYININDFGDLITVNADPKSKNGNFACKAIVSYYDNKTAVLPFTVKVTGSDVKVGLTGKKGKIDLNDRENTSISYMPKISNYKGEIKEVWLAMQGEDDLSDKFSVDLKENGRVEISANSGLGYDEEFIFGATYKLKLGFKLEAISASAQGDLFYEQTEDTVVSVKPVRSVVKHKLPKPLTIYQSRSSYKEIIDLTPATPSGASIDIESFNIYNAGNKTFFLYLGYDQKLHLMLRDNASVKPGKMKLTIPVAYEGQGLDKKGANYFYQPRNISIDVKIER